MIALLWVACAEDPATEDLPDVPICNCRPPEDGSVTEEFPVVAAPVDVLLAVDPVLLEEVVAELPSLVDELIDEGVDARVGLVSTALGDPSTAGDLVPLGPEGWWVPGAPLELADVPVPDQPPLGGLGATFLALQDARRSAVVRVLVAQEADDATPVTIVSVPELVDWLDGLGDVELSALAPVPAPRLDAAVEDLGGARYELGTDLAVVLGDLGTSAPARTRTFAMAGRPQDGTLVVEVLDAFGRLLPPFDEGDDWVFDAARNTVTFVAYVPGPGSRVVVSYSPLE